MVETEKIQVIKTAPLRPVVSDTETTPAKTGYLFVKRVLDILIAGFALILLSPLFLLVIILLKITGEHEVFYQQKRIGYKNRPFHIWKFATMLKNSPNIGTGEITLRNDPRVTPVGKILRRTKMNELPQIINVLKGDMSIVGPRPLMEISFKLYSSQVQRIIYQSRPGITGIASIVFRDEEKMLSEARDAKATYASIYPYKADLEMWYQSKASLSTDIAIIFLTAASICAPSSNLVEKVFTDLPARPDNLVP